MIKPGAGLGIVNIPPGQLNSQGGPSFSDGNRKLQPNFVPGHPNPQSGGVSVHTEILGKTPYNGATGPMSDQQQQER